MPTWTPRMTRSDIRWQEEQSWAAGVKQDDNSPWWQEQAEKARVECEGYYTPAQMCDIGTKLPKDATWYDRFFTYTTYAKEARAQARRAEAERVAKEMERMEPDAVSVRQSMNQRRRVR